MQEIDGRQKPRTLGDDPQRALRTDEQLGGIKPCAALPRPPSRLDDFTVREHDCLQKRKKNKSPQKETTEEQGQWTVLNGGKSDRAETHDVQEPLALGRAVPHSVRYRATPSESAASWAEHGEKKRTQRCLLPEHPVLIIPPMDAPGAGSICGGGQGGVSGSVFAIF